MHFNLAALSLMTHFMNAPEQPAKMWFKVVGHRPFDNNCMSTNIVSASSSEEAKQSMISYYGFRNEDDADKMKPNVIIDEVSSLVNSKL